MKTYSPRCRNISLPRVHIWLPPKFRDALKPLEAWNSLGRGKIHAAIVIDHLTSEHVQQTTISPPCLNILRHSTHTLLRDETHVIKPYGAKPFMPGLRETFPSRLAVAPHERRLVATRCSRPSWKYQRCFAG